LARHPPEPPPQLDVIASELWRSILAEWDVPDRAGRALLEQACAAYGMAERLRRQIAADGEMIETDNGVGMKLNPMIVAEIAARSLTARMLSRLGVLDTEPKRGDNHTHWLPSACSKSPCARRSGERDNELRRLGHHRGAERPRDVSLWRKVATKSNVGPTLNKKVAAALWRSEPIAPKHNPPKAAGGKFLSLARDVDRQFFADFKEFADVVN
jgi:terminase small subunit-like protein